MFAKNEKKTNAFLRDADGFSGSSETDIRG